LRPRRIHGKGGYEFREGFYAAAFELPEPATWKRGAATWTASHIVRSSLLKGYVIRPSRAQGDGHVVAETDQARGLLGAIAGLSPTGIEGEDDVA